MQTQVVIKDTNIDDAFIIVQKRQCGAVYASAADLKTLVAALKRNEIPYAISSLWNLPADVEREEKELAEKKAKEAQEEAERKERNKDEFQLGLQRKQAPEPRARRATTRFAPEIRRQCECGRPYPKFRNHGLATRIRAARSPYSTRRTARG